MSLGAEVQKCAVHAWEVLVSSAWLYRWLRLGALAEINFITILMPAYTVWPSRVWHKTWDSDSAHETRGLSAYKAYSALDHQSAV